MIKELLKKLRLAEGSLSTILGALVVLVVGILLFNYFRGRPAVKLLPSLKEEAPTQQEVVKTEPTPAVSLPAAHKVEKGEHLWKIALNYYGSGYNWVDIVKENRLKNPNRLLVGQELKIPAVAVRTEKVLLPKTGQGEAVLEPISGGSYTVMQGDNLWQIAVRAYQDGFKWPEVAKANELVNPNLIHPGNVLELPR